MTESEVFEAVTGRGSSDFAILVRILNEHSPWCLIGGLAVNGYVEGIVLWRTLRAEQSGLGVTSEGDRQNERKMSWT